MDYPHRAGLMVAVPHTGRPLPPLWAWSLAHMSPPINYNIIYAHNIAQNGFTVTGHVDMLRNHFLRQAMERNCKYLFFIDEDVTFPPHALSQLIYMAEKTPDAAVISGIYVTKSDPVWPLVFRGDGGGPYWDWRVGEFFEGSGCGMGCALLRVDAFRDIEEPWFLTDKKMSQEVDAPLMVEAHTEDLHACKKLRGAGWKIYFDASILCKHWTMDTLQPYVLPLDSPPMQRFYFENDLPKVLILGLDMTVQPEFQASILRADWREDKDADYRVQPTKLPFQAKSFDLSVLEHTLQNFDYQTALEVLTETIRVTKDKGGQIRVVVPNIRLLLESDDLLFSILYQDKTYYTPNELRRLLEAAQAKTGRDDLKWDITLNGKHIVAAITVGTAEVEGVRDIEEEAETPQAEEVVASHVVPAPDNILELPAAHIGPKDNVSFLDEVQLELAKSI